MFKIYATIWFFFTGCDNYKGVPKQFLPELPQGPSMSNELIDLEWLTEKFANRMGSQSEYSSYPIPLTDIKLPRQH